MNHPVTAAANLSPKEEDTCVSIFASIMRCHSMLHRMASAVAGDFDLHLAELNVIDMLGKNGSLTMGELSSVTFIAPSSTTRTVKQLEIYGLVIRKRSSTSARVVHVSLTRSGRNLFRKAYPEVLNSVHQRLLESLNRGERKQLSTLLQKLSP